MRVSTYLLLFTAMAALTVVVTVIALWKHKKSGTGKLQLIGATGVVEAALSPEGTVLIDREIWRARSLDGTTIAAREVVKVAGFQGHLILIKR